MNKDDVERIRQEVQDAMAWNMEGYDFHKIIDDLAGKLTKEEKEWAKKNLDWGVSVIDAADVVWEPATGANLEVVAVGEENQGMTKEMFKLLIYAPDDASPEDEEITPKLKFYIYWGSDYTPVVEILTDEMDEDKNGPILRVWLNDETVWENPPVPKE